MTDEEILEACRNIPWMKNERWSDENGSYSSWDISSGDGEKVMKIKTGDGGAIMQYKAFIKALEPEETELKKLRNFMNTTKFPTKEEIEEQVKKYFYE